MAAKDIVHFDIATVAEKSADFRRVLWTGEHSQLVIMTIPPGGEIGEETHDENDQILSFVSGVGKAVIEAGLGPLQAAWLRIATAALVLVPLVVLLRGRSAARGLRPHLPRLVVYGLTGVAGCQACYFVAASRLPVGVAILLEFSGPVIVLAWLRLVRRVPVHRAAAAGVSRVLVRVTPGVEADTHEAIRTGHRGSKFGLDPDDAVAAVRAARDANLDVGGVHVHVGSQLADVRAHLLAVE